MMIANEQQKTRRQKKQKKPEQPTEITFLEHFYELRKRLFWVVLTLVVTSALGFQYKDWLISAVIAPLHGQKLVYLTPAGGFSFIFTLSIYFGALLSIPVVIYQIYRFLQPLLGRSSRRLAATLISLSVVLAAAGAAFGYFVTIPGAINFLSNFAGDAVIPNLTAESYLNFVVAYVLGLAALFQLPLLLFLFDHIRPIPPGMLSSTQRFVIIGATILAAVITPTPDALNMAIVAIPIIVVYEFGAFAVFVRHRIRSAKRNPAPFPAAEPSFAVGDQSEKEPLAEPVSQLVAPTQLLMQQKRTIDGMLITRQAPTRVIIPPRTNVQSHLSKQRISSDRPLRSLDGFSMVS